jgi:hypothetical protein
VVELPPVCHGVLAVLYCSSCRCRRCRRRRYLLIPFPLAYTVFIIISSLFITCSRVLSSTQYTIHNNNNDKKKIETGLGCTPHDTPLNPSQHAPCFLLGLIYRWTWISLRLSCSLAPWTSPFGIDALAQFCLALQRSKDRSRASHRPQATATKASKASRVVWVCLCTSPTATG